VEVKMMAKEPKKRIKVPEGSELARLLTEAGGAPLLLEKDGELYRLERMEKEPEDIFEGYDPEKVKEAIATYAGSWAHLDTDTMIEEIYEAREKGSRPANRP
jgi:hypothetical protein